MASAHDFLVVVLTTFESGCRGQFSGFLLVSDRMLPSYPMMCAAIASTSGGTTELPSCR